MRGEILPDRCNLPLVSAAFDLDLDRDRLRHRHRAPRLIFSALRETRGRRYEARALSRRLTLLRTQVAGKRSCSPAVA